VLLQQPFDSLITHLEGLSVLYLPRWSSSRPTHSGFSEHSRPSWYSPTRCLTKARSEANTSLHVGQAHSLSPLSW